MHILITNHVGDKIVRKVSDIRTIYKNIKDEVFICFNGAKNTPIRIDETPEDFFNKYLAK
jgi:hypothetical protein